MSRCRDAGSAREPDLSQRLLWPALLLWGAVKVWLTWTRYLNQDEFETLHQGWLTFQGAVPYRDFSSNHPPLAYIWLGWLNVLTDDATMLIRWARGLTLAAAALVLYLVHRMAHDIYGPAAGRWAAIVYGVNATFWEWSTEIRTDFVMLPLWLAAMSLLFSRWPKSISVRMMLIGILMGTAFWVNQKVVFHALPVGVYLLWNSRRGSWRLKDVGWAVGASLLPAIVVLAMVWANGSLGDLFHHTFLGGNAWGLVQDNYYGKWRALTIRCGVLRDAGFVTVGLLACVWGGAAERSRAQSFMTLAALWMLLTLFLNPSPFHYYLLSIFPLFAVTIGGWLAHCTAHAQARGPHQGIWYRLAVTAAIAGYVYFPLARMTRFIRPTIGYQLEVLQVARQIAPHGTPVFDGSGTLVTQPDAYPYHWVFWKPVRAAYRAGKLPPLVPVLRENGCRLVVETYRVRYLMPEDRRQLQTQFARLWGPLGVPGFDSIDPIDELPHEFELWYDGRYRADRSGVVVDGEPLTEPRQLTAGRHTISIQGGPSRVRLYMIDGIDLDALPPERHDPIEFLDYYGYRY